MNPSTRLATTIMAGYVLCVDIKKQLTRCIITWPQLTSLYAEKAYYVIICSNPV
jgi:hypothetical protein